MTVKEVVFIDEIKDYIILKYSDGKSKKIKKKRITRSEAIKKIKETLEAKIKLNSRAKQKIINSYIGKWENLRSYEIEYIMIDLYGYGYIIAD